MTIISDPGDEMEHIYSLNDIELCMAQSIMAVEIYKGILSETLEKNKAQLDDRKRNALRNLMIYGDVGDISMFND